MILRNRITNNSIDLDDMDGSNPNGGGGMMIYLWVEVALIENNFIGYNTSNWIKGGAGMVGHGRIVNNTFNGNYSANHYAALVLNDSSEIINNIFVNNENSVINTDRRTVLVENNSFYNNTYFILDGYTDVAFMDSSLTYCNNNIACDPEFEPASDYLLSSTSCCIDTGSSYFAPFEDIDGDPRPQGTDWDIGADEHPSGLRIPTYGIPAQIFLAAFIPLLLIFLHASTGTSTYRAS